MGYYEFEYSIDQNHLSGNQLYKIDFLSNYRFFPEKSSTYYDILYTKRKIKDVVLYFKLSIVFILRPIK